MYSSITDEFKDLVERLDQESKSYENITFNGWIIDIGTPENAFLSFQIYIRPRPFRL